MTAEIHPNKEFETHSFSSRDQVLIPPINDSDNSITEQNELVDLSDPLAITAKLNIFVDKLHLPMRALDIYCKWKGVNKREALLLGKMSATQFSRSQNEMIAQAEAAFNDLFNGAEEGIFKRDYGESADGYLRIKGDVVKTHEEYAQAAYANVDQITTKDRVTTALKVLKQVPGLSEEQKAELLTVSGYSADDMMLIAKRFGGSIPLYGFLYASSDITSDVLGFVGGIAKPLENNTINDPKTLAIVLGSAGAYYLSKYGQAVQAEGMLKDDRVKRVPNPSAVLGYYLAHKLFPDNEKAQKWFTRMSYVANPLELQQERWWAMAPVNPSIFIAGNVVSTVINTAQLGVIELSKRQEIWQANREKNQSTNVNESLEVT